MAAWYVKDRLDRDVANNSWRAIFPMVRVTNGDPRHSNHRPIITDVGQRERMERSGHMHIFPKFEDRWLKEENCVAQVKEAWSKGN